MNEYGNIAIYDTYNYIYSFPGVVGNSYDVCELRLYSYDNTIIKTINDFKPNEKYQFTTNEKQLINTLTTKNDRYVRLYTTIYQYEDSSKINLVNTIESFSHHDLDGRFGLNNKYKNELQLLSYTEYYDKYNSFKINETDLIKNLSRVKLDFKLNSPYNGSFFVDARGNLKNFYINNSSAGYTIQEDDDTIIHSRNNLILSDKFQITSNSYDARGNSIIGEFTADSYDADIKVVQYEYPTISVKAQRITPDSNEITLNIIAEFYNGENLNSDFKGYISVGIRENESAPLRNIYNETISNADLKTNNKIVRNIVVDNLINLQAKQYIEAGAYDSLSNIDDKIIIAKTIISKAKPVFWAYTDSNDIDHLVVEGQLDLNGAIDELSVGHIESKNLYIADETYSFTPTSSTWYYINGQAGAYGSDIGDKTNLKAYVKNGEIYTIKVETIENVNNAQLVYYDEEVIVTGTTSIKNGYTFTATKTGYVVLRLNVATGSNVRISHIQLEKGDKATSYYHHEDFKNVDLSKEIIVGQVKTKNLATTLRKNIFPSVSDGGDREGSNTCSTNFIEIKSSTKYTTSYNCTDNSLLYIFYYDNNKNFITQYNFARNDGYVSLMQQSPSNANYVKIRFDTPADKIINLQFEEGPTLTEYFPHQNLGEVELLPVSILISNSSVTLDNTQTKATYNNQNKLLVISCGFRTTASISSYLALFEIKINGQTLESDIYDPIVCMASNKNTIVPLYYDKDAKRIKTRLALETNANYSFTFIKQL